MGRPGALATGGWTLQEEVPATTLSSQAAFPRGANPKHTPKSVHNTDATRDTIHSSHKQPSRWVWESGDLV